MKSDRNITLLQSDVQQFPTSPVVIVLTTAGEAQFPIGKNFSGDFTLNFNDGGLAGVWKKEKLK